MTEITVDRTNLKRQAQRTESYSILLSKRRAITNDTINLRKQRIEHLERSHNLEYFNIGVKESEEEKKIMSYNEKSSSPTSFSSDSSQEFHPKELCRNLRLVQNNSQQFEIDTSPVMTRSATRKYSTVGAIFNKVNYEQELRIKKRWPVSAGCVPPTIPPESLQLQHVMSRSLNFVMSFCKYATYFEIETSQEEHNTNIAFEMEKSMNFFDLSSYIAQGSVTDIGNEQAQITLHLNESLLSHQFINIISINNEEESQALVIQENDNELETITLHPGETFVLDNKYLPNSNSVFVSPHDTKSSKASDTLPPEEPMKAVYNDHTYAMRYSENINVAKSQSNETQVSVKQDESELIFKNALKDLLLNTAILKCLICGETPQEMTEFLDRAHHG